MWCSGSLHANMIPFKINCIISSLSDLTGLVVRRTVASHTTIVLTRNGMQLTDGRHHQKISEIAVPAYSTHLREGKTFNTAMLVTIPWAVVTACNRVRAHLHHAIGCRCPRKSLSQTMISTCGTNTCTGTNKWIDIVCWTGNRMISATSTRCRRHD